MLRQKLASFFYHNRFAMDTAEGLSQWIGCPSDDVSAAAEALVSDGILVKRGNNASTVYAMAPKSEVRQRVADLIRLA